MGFWTERVVPHLVDRTLSTPPVMRLRAATVTGLSGRVLEIGYGSGLNTALYPPEVRAVDAVEPSDVGWAMSHERRTRARVPIERIGLDGQSLSAPDGRYDAVLCTFALCTIPDAARTLEEVRRVLVPGGALHLLEHGLSPDPRTARWQHRLDAFQGAIAGGCHLDRHIPAMAEAAGLTPAALEASYLPGPAIGRPWAYVYRGVYRSLAVA